MAVGSPTASFINEGATNRYNSDVLRITAYVAWALANTGYQGPAVEKAKAYIESHSGAKLDSYTLAIIANFAADYEKDRDFTQRSMQALIDARIAKDDQVFWTVEETSVYSTGVSAAVETTGLAAQALLKWGEASEIVRKSLNFISAKKEASGNWGTTQATIMALRALLLASQRSASDVRGSVAIMLNGKAVETLRLSSENNDLLQQFVFKGIDARQPNSVELKFEGTGGLAYQVAGRYYTPWEERPVVEPLSIDVAYDRTRLAQNDIATEKVTIRNNLKRPPIWSWLISVSRPDSTCSAKICKRCRISRWGTPGRLEKFSLTATQAILYFDALSGETNGHVHRPPARQISDPGPHLPIAGLRVLRSGAERDRTSRSIGGNSARRQSSISTHSPPNKQPRLPSTCAPNIQSGPATFNRGCTSITLRSRTRPHIPFNWR